MKANHPSTYIDNSQAGIIRGHALAAEQLKQLHPSQLEIIYRQNWFRAFVPKSKGGLELSLPEALQLEEALAWTDGSLGWTVTLCAGAGWFIGFLDPKLTDEVYSNEKICLAGSGKPDGIAKKIKDGYEISGSWNYATGAPHATAFTANCIIHENGQPMQNEKGEPLMKAFLFRRNEVTIHDNWKSMGMIATASQAFEVKNLIVTEERLFVPDREHTVIHSPIFQYPFMPFAEATLAVNVSGMAVRFLDLCESYFNKKASYSMLAKLEDTKQEMTKARHFFYSIIEDSWNKCASSLPVETELLNEITNACKQLVYIARKALNELYPCCGLAALDPSTEINRLWRNLHTATQHTLLNGCA